MPSARRRIVVFACLSSVLGLPPSGMAQEPARPSVDVPRLSRPPAFEDFLDMRPDGDVERTMAKVDRFIQQEPTDGAEPTEHTETYLGYDESHLYLVFVAFATDPAQIRARLTRREDVFNDDYVTVQIDTFNDRRRAFTFLANPLGVQVDGMLTEARGLNFDTSFDTVWRSNGRVTERGYVVWIAIPFRSLRFPAAPEQRWGLILARENIRGVETAFWPRVSSRIESRLIQAAELRGLRDISPGRNAQIVPYAFYRAFETLDPDRSGWSRDLDPDAGVDAKVVLRDSLVVDLTANPDFSQVESDEPQVTTNRRFEVFFPERRPFFLENASFFETPINLLFTRRVTDPTAGLRITGKLGAYAVAAMAMDDRGDDAVTAVRVSRDFFRQSSLGGIYTRRAANGRDNAVAGIDGRFGFGPQWSMSVQSIVSTTTEAGATLRGSASEVELRRSGRQLNLTAAFADRHDQFRTDLGFEPRRGIRRVQSQVRYRFRPENRWVIAYGPNVDASTVWDRDGRRLDRVFSTGMAFTFARLSNLVLSYSGERERLRPGDAPNLAAPIDVERSRWTAAGSLRLFPRVIAEGEWNAGAAVNLNPVDGAVPAQGPSREWQLTITVQPITPLRIDTTTLTSTLRTALRAPVFENRIVRAKANWQLTRELAIRTIVQHERTTADPHLTTLPQLRRFNADLLVSYVINPWTAIYAGYNGNASALNPPGDRLHRDAQQLFAKVSYLYRF